MRFFALCLLASAAFADGTVRGVVRFVGTPPKVELIKNRSDPFCSRKTLINEEVLVRHGNLANVVVAVMGAPASSPHVQGIVAKQRVRVVNLDETLHNLHPYKGTSTLWGYAQVPGPHQKIDPLYSATAGVIKLKCDVHQWMTGYLFVHENSLFAVSDENGAFEIRDVPAGKYSLKAWHERYEERAVELTVVDGAISEVEIVYSAR
jgi:hypothetical protein